MSENIQVKQLKPVYPAEEHENVRALLDYAAETYGDDAAFILKEKKAGRKAEPVYRNISYKDLREDDVKRYIAGWLKKSGKKIRGDDASYLISLAGKDLYTLNQEINKLISYTGKEEIVSRADIDALVTAKIEDKIFDLTDAIAAGNKDLVKKRYREMIMLREPPLRILYMLIRQYRILLIVYDMDRRRMQDVEIAQAAGIRDFAVRKNRKLLRGYDEKTLTGIMELCLDTETRIKTGQVGDQIGLEALLISLTERIYK